MHVIKQSITTWPSLKSLVHLNEEEQIITIDSLINEVVMTFSLHNPVVNDEPVVLNDLEQQSSSHQISESSGKPVSFY